MWVLVNLYVCEPQKCTSLNRGCHILPIAFVLTQLAVGITNVQIEYALSYTSS